MALKEGHVKPPHALMVGKGEGFVHFGTSDRR
jgi:hypothetical protein